MLFALAGLVLVVAIYGPSLWVRYVMHRHGDQIADMPGNARELAEHLIRRFDLPGVVVEEGGEQENHFDPGANAVRLSPDLFSAKSLTAIAVAAHEVGHAIQFHRREKLLLWRTTMLPKLKKLETLSVVALMLIPVTGALLRIPHPVLVLGLLIFFFMASRILFHAVTLPTEWDASFGKALPILQQGNYIPEAHLPAVRQVLKAAALTYVAGALADMVSIWRWVRFLR